MRDRHWTSFLLFYTFHVIYAVRGVKIPSPIRVPCLARIVSTAIDVLCITRFRVLAWSRARDTDSTRTVENMIRILVEGSEGKKRVRPSSSLRSSHLTCSADYSGIRGG
ncbi:hypothetical protein BDV41DRAFT_421134 [Aspergillus transmontanensis]|uniref:Secreted protein n=1 Tax=Aspergillus transmontanensis TaxID=1034304 RepID=A0A5N6VM95_9EURO|nr:hypothetical protein BDV41DRAFT_421134 [Aspergillus transmontanensis]